jgi:hypothetical protein
LYRFTLRIACLHSTIAVFVPLLHFLSNPVCITDNRLMTWKRILCEKLVVPHLIKKFRAFKVKKRCCSSTRHVSSSKNEGITPLVLILGNVLSDRLCAKGAFSGESSVSQRIEGFFFIVVLYILITLKFLSPKNAHFIEHIKC